MLDEYLGKNEVINFINQLRFNPKYNVVCNNPFKNIDNDLALYIFYDALLKYKIIIDDDNYFDEFFSQLEKVYKKVDDYDDILFAINKLICFIVSQKLNISYLDEEESKKKIIKYLYDKYISNGYYVHGFSTVYEDSIKNDGFVSEIYINNYQKMVKLKDIFNKYHCLELLEKDFTLNKTYFTDNAIMGCYYSMCSPGFFYDMLFNSNVFGNELDYYSYFKADYDTSINYLTKFMNDMLFDNKDVKFVLDTVKEECDYLSKVPKKVSLLLAKRNLFESNHKVSVNDYFRDDDIYEIADAILSPKNANVSFDGVLSADHIEIISLYPFTDKQFSDEKNVKESDDIVENEYKDIDKDIDKNIKEDNSGSISLFLILGSLFISLGVILTIVSIIRGI